MTNVDKTASQRGFLALLGGGALTNGYSYEVHWSAETGLLAFFSKLHGVMHDDGDRPAFRAFDLKTGRLRSEISYWHGKMRNRPGVELWHRYPDDLPEPRLRVNTHMARRGRFSARRRV